MDALDSLQALRSRIQVMEAVIEEQCREIMRKSAALHILYTSAASKEQPAVAPSAASTAASTAAPSVAPSAPPTRNLRRPDQHSRTPQARSSHFTTRYLADLVQESTW